MRIREKSSSRGFGWLILELIIVFGGVYTAFLLTNYQERNREKEYAVSIYSYFLSECELERPHIEAEKVAFDSMATVFLNAYQLGEMPDIVGVPSFFTSSVNIRVWEAALQSGGVDVLDFEAIRKIDQYENAKLGMLKLLEKGDIYSRELLLPNMERSKSEYYNLWTKKLRPKYQWYIRFIRSIQNQYKEMMDANIELTDYLGKKVPGSD